MALVALLLGSVIANGLLLVREPVVTYRCDADTKPFMPPGDDMPMTGNPRY